MNEVKEAYAWVPALPGSVAVASLAVYLEPCRMNDDRETRRYLVSGRVQGVGFRWFVEREAATLGLTGWVRNVPETCRPWFRRTNNPFGCSSHYVIAVLPLDSLLR
jgi:hypothetical protein